MIASFLTGCLATLNVPTLRIGIATLLLALGATAAAADPRLVRVIWDVGDSAVYYKEYTRTEAGYGAFRVPASGRDASTELFVRLSTPRVDFLKKGDHVRLYVVNYNRVSHVWHESSSVEQIASEPSLVGPLLNALVLAITGAGALPSQVPPFERRSMFGTTPARRDTCETTLAPVDTALAVVATSAQEVHRLAKEVLQEAIDKGLNARAKALAGVPANDRMWNTFDTAAAWRLVLNEKDVLGINFANEFTQLGKSIDALGKEIDRANAALLEADRVIVTTTVPTECNDAGDARTQRRTNLVTFLQEVAGAGSPVRSVIAKHETGTALWTEIERKLTKSSWAEGAIELAVKDAIGADGVLRVDGIFASPVEKFDQRIQRSVVLGIRTHMPALVISSGIGVNDFDFKTIQLSSATAGAGDAIAVKPRLAIVDDTSWEPLSPVWLQNVGGLRIKEVGVYGTFGTTPDRNIFNNLIYGGSVYVPRWRTVFTVGAIMARGHEEDDLEALRQQFSDANGFARDGVEVDSLPLSKTKWATSGYFSVSFALVSF